MKVATGMALGITLSFVLGVVLSQSHGRDSELALRLMSQGAFGADFDAVEVRAEIIDDKIGSAKSIQYCCGYGDDAGQCISVTEDTIDLCDMGGGVQPGSDSTCGGACSTASSYSAFSSSEPEEPSSSSSSSEEWCCKDNNCSML